MKILQEKRGIQIDLEYTSVNKVKLVYELPMNEMIFDFHKPFLVVMLPWTTKSLTTEMATLLR